MATTETPANKKHGYVFGCDGVVDLSKAGELLGVVPLTVRKYAKEGRIRIGKHPGNSKNVICRRSIREYLSSLEN